MTHAFASTQKPLGKKTSYFSLPELAKQFPNVKRMPISDAHRARERAAQLRRQKVTAEHVKQLANWKPKAERSDEIPFVVARVVLQDFTGVPLLADLAAMRNVAKRWARTRRRSSRWCRWTWWSTTA